MDKAKSKDREKTLRAAGVKTHSTFGRVTESVAAGCWLLSRKKTEAGRQLHHIFKMLRKACQLRILNSAKVSLKEKPK